MFHFLLVFKLFSNRDDMLVHINMVKVFANQLRSIKVNIMDEDVYMVLLMNLF